jgi:hypothetical protein
MSSAAALRRDKFASLRSRNPTRRQALFTNPPFHRSVRGAQTLRPVAVKSRRGRIEVYMVVGPGNVLGLHLPDPAEEYDVVRTFAQMRIPGVRPKARSIQLRFDTTEFPHEDVIEPTSNRSRQIALQRGRLGTSRASDPSPPSADYAEETRIFRRGALFALSALTTSAALLPFVPEVAIFGIAAVFVVLGGTILMDATVSPKPIADPRLGTLLVLTGLGTLIVALVGLAT